MMYQVHVNNLPGVRVLIIYQVLMIYQVLTISQVIDISTVLMI